MVLSVLTWIAISSLARVPSGVGVTARFMASGVRATDKLASLARIVASSALESLGIRRKEPKIKAMRKEPIPTKSVRKILWALVWERLSLGLV